MLIQGNEQHDGHPHGHPQHLQDNLQPVTLVLLVLGDGVRVARRQFWHHVHQSNIQEDASSGCEYPWGEVVDGAKEEANHHSNASQDGRQDIVEDCLLDGHPSFQQHGEVT